MLVFGGMATTSRGASCLGLPSKVKCRGDSPRKPGSIGQGRERKVYTPRLYAIYALELRPERHMKHNADYFGMSGSLWRILGCLQSDSTDSAAPLRRDATRIIIRYHPRAIDLVALGVRLIVMDDDRRFLRRGVP